MSKGGGEGSDGGLDLERRRELYSHSGGVDYFVDLIGSNICGAEFP